MRHLPALLLILALAGCGANPLSLLTGGGPNVAANVQAGKTNSQTIGQTNLIEQSVKAAERVEQSTGETRVRTERVETIVVNESIPAWVWLLAIFLAVMDSPLRWPGQAIAYYRKLKSA